MSTTTTPTQSSNAKNPPPKTSQPPQQQQSKPQPQSTIFNAQTIKDNWKQLIGLAKKKWDKLTDAELTNAGGDEQKLSTLVKDRYGIKQDEANQQVKGFFAKNSSK